MNEQHPITPPPELILEWCRGWNCTAELTALKVVATQAARWGSDQELEACCEWMLANARFLDAGWIERLRASRRSKPQSLKAQALAWCNDYIDPDGVIRRALEQLDD